MEEEEKRKKKTRYGTTEWKGNKDWQGRIAQIAQIAQVDAAFAQVDAALDGAGLAWRALRRVCVCTCLTI